MIVWPNWFPGAKYELRYISFMCSLTAKWMGGTAPEWDDSRQPTPNFSCAANINLKAHNTLKKCIKDVIHQVTSLSFPECQIVQNWNEEKKDYLPLNKGPHYILTTLCTLATALEPICVQNSCIHHIRQICIVYYRDKLQSFDIAVTGIYTA